MSDHKTSTKEKEVDNHGSPLSPFSSCSIEASPHGRRFRDPGRAQCRHFLCRAAFRDPAIHLSNKGATLFCNEGLLLSVAARDGSQTRIRPEQKKNAREHKLDEYMKQRKGYCDEQGKWTTLTFDENGESEYKNKQVWAYSEYADSQFDPTLTEERTVVMQTCEIEDEDGESGWIIHRIGPMVGIGGYDRHEITVINLPHPHKAKFFTQR